MKATIASVALAVAGPVLAAEPPFLTTRPAESTIEPTQASISAAAATVKPLSPTSDVKGVAFDRIIQIWLENQDYNVSAADPNMQWLATQGILLTNYFGTTHPSEPNYAAVVAGDHFGMDNDDFNQFPSNISTVVDLLDTKAISWAEYQEDLPYPGFQGFNYSNQKTFANDYVRKHNPLILFENVASNATRSVQIKNFTSFYDDLNAKTLPQWSFITPNMTNDGHDTNITFTAAWARTFLGPLLNNTYFMNNTLIVLSFDESETYPLPNRVYTVLLGGAIDSSLHGTEDSTYYSHYSTISTVSANWGLPSLGRWDCGANVFALVANKTGYKNADVDLAHLYFNQSYPGAVSDAKYTPGWWPAPNTEAKCAAGQGVLASIKSAWGNGTGDYNYTNVFPYNEPEDNNVGGTPTVDANDAANATGSGSGTGTTSPSPSKTNAASVAKPELFTFLGLAGLLAAFL